VNAVKEGQTKLVAVFSSQVDLIAKLKYSEAKVRFEKCVDKEGWLCLSAKMLRIIGLKGALGSQGSVGDISCIQNTI
jgi:hypothetical protein